MTFHQKIKFFNKDALILDFSSVNNSKNKNLDLKIEFRVGFFSRKLYKKIHEEILQSFVEIRL